VNEEVFSSPAVAEETVYVGADDGAVYALSGKAAGRFVPWKAVYYDEKLSGWFSGGKALADYLGGRGFQRLDAAALPVFLTARAEDRVPSVVVFASDEPPSAIAEGETSSSIVCYLRAGGRAVWVGIHPFALKFDEATGARTGIDYSRTRGLLGVGADAPGIESIEDLAGLATPEGRDWGLPATSIFSQPVDAKDVTVALARDPEGRANAWMKAIGEGQFVRIWGRRRAIADLDVVRRLAEHAVAAKADP
jgi:hypothetical protein